MNKDRVIPAGVCFVLALAIYAYSASRHGAFNLDFLYGMLAGIGIGLLLVGTAALRKFRDGLALYFFKEQNSHE